jgi:hypothetical protein
MQTSREPSSRVSLLARPKSKAGFTSPTNKLFGLIGVKIAKSTTTATPRGLPNLVPLSPRVQRLFMLSRVEIAPTQGKLQLDAVLLFPADLKH